MEQIEKPGYYSVIPAEVRYDKELTLLSRMLYGEISCLANKEGYCWATNSYFANLYDVSNTTISNSISSLVKKNYISSELIYKEGSKEIDLRKLRIKNILNTPIQNNFNSPIQNNFNSPIQNNLNTPIQKNCKDNNINNNIINNNTINSDDTISSSENKNNYEIKKNYYEAADHIITYLNGVCGTKFKSNTSATRKCISARLKEGFTIQDFEKVIEWKYLQWGKKPVRFSNGSMSNNYLKPDTLFSNKFEGYLNEANMNLVYVDSESEYNNEVKIDEDHKVLKEY